MKISDDDLRRALQRDLDPVRLSPFARQRILNAARTPPRRRRAGRFFRRLTIAAATLAGCFAFSVGTLAAMPDLAARLTTVSAETLSLLTPLSVTARDEGIQCEVIASLNDGDAALFYVSLTDTTGQNRLDETLSLPELQVQGMDLAYCDSVTMDENGSAILRITAQNFTDPVPRKVRLHIGTLLTGQEVHTEAGAGYRLSDLMEQLPAPAVTLPRHYQSYAYSGGPEGELARRLDGGRLPLLAASYSRPSEPYPWLTTLGMGAVGPDLHILAETAPEARYNNVSFFLTDGRGVRLDLPTAVIDRYDNSREAMGGIPADTDPLRREYVCTLPPDADPSQLFVGSELLSYDHIEGSWDTVFRLEKSAPPLVLPCELRAGTLDLDQVELSLAGIAFRGLSRESERLISPSYCLTLKDGTRIEDTSSTSSSFTMLGGADDPVLIRSLFDQPLDLSQLETVVVGGRVLWTAQP